MDVSPDPPPTSGLARLRRWPLSWLAVGWLLALVGLDTQLTQDLPPVELDVEIDSSVPSLAQVFFDTGHSFNEKDSVAVPIAAGSQTLAFPVPTGEISALRFDPLTVAGTVQVRRAFLRRRDSQQELRSFDLGRITAASEIARMDLQPDGLTVVTTPGSIDSQLRLPVSAPILTEPSLTERVVNWVGVDVSVTLLALLAVGLGSYLWPKVRLRAAPSLARLAAPVFWIDGHFRRWAARFNRPEIVQLHHGVFWFYAVCALVFGAMAAAGWHGSSLTEYNTRFVWSDAKTAPLYGEPRGIRSDEWAQQTPAFLNQAFRDRHYAARTTSVGGQNAALLYSIPANDFSQVFRPQYWAFHFLPVASAFAIYWQAKGFLLVTGVFSLLLVLTGGRGALAALGALWFFFSAHVQWCYSWPSMLPEMIGSFGWTICLTLYLSVGRSRYLLAVAAVACVFSAMNFALCLYPPHQIPFVWFGAGIVVAWLWWHRAAVFRRDLIVRHLLALAFCWVAVAVALAAFVLETREAFTVAAHTVYPGQRIVGGGGMPFHEFVAHSFDFWKTEAHFPAQNGNVCEGTGFLWLLPFTVFAFGRRRVAGSFAGTAMLAVCWIVAALIGTWVIFPVPASVGHWLLFDRVTVSRCVPTLGLINVVGTIVFLALPARDEGFTVGHVNIPGIAAVGIVITALLTLTNVAYQDFFPTYQVVLTIFYCTALVVCLLHRWKAVLAVTLLVPLIRTNGLINPVNRGLDVVTRSALFQAVQADPNLRKGRWLVYSHDITLPGFAVATGLDVFNSFKVLPNLAGMAAFDPTGRSVNAYNQSGFTIARPLPEGQPCAFDAASTGVLRWSVSPLDPALRDVGVRFVMFDEKPSAELVAKLKPVLTNVPLVFVYELP